MLARAVDTPLRTWVSSVNSTWFRQTAVTHDGVDAAQSGAIDDDEITALVTLVDGPGTLSYWWKVSAASGDYLRFYENGSHERSISGETDWVQVVHPVASGTQRYVWQYEKSRSGVAGSDAGWIDEVVFTPDAPAGLADAIDISPNSAIATYPGAGPWFRQTAIKHDGSDAAQSPMVGGNSLAWFETVVHGPGNVVVLVQDFL